MEIGIILRAMSRNKLRFGLIAAQIAITLAIVANCVTLILDARTKMNIQSGLDDENLVVGILSIPKPELRDDDIRRDAWFEEALAEMRRIHGVRSISATNLGLWMGMGVGNIRPAHSNDEWSRVGVPRVDEFVPDTIGLVVEEGRWFTHEDVQRSKQALFAAIKNRARLDNERAGERLTMDVVVSRALGRHLFGDGPILGRMIEDREGDMGRIIGVSSDVHFSILRGDIRSDQYAIFYPGAGHSYQYGGRYYVRVEPGQTDEVAKRIDEYVRTRYEIGDVLAWPVTKWRDQYFGPQRLIVTLMGLLVVLLLFVASLSIAGLSSFSVTERTRQIGVRRALGATTNDILRYFLTESAIVTMTGLFVGAGLAALLNIGILQFYEGAKINSVIVAGGALLLFIVALAAGFPQALRASRISPAIATRNV